MRLIPVLSVIGLLSAAAVTLAARQAHHSPLDQRGAAVMGFDQELTTHHFFLFTDGGAIDVSVRQPSDTQNLGAIRSHLPHIAMMFSDGNFEAPMLVHDSTNVPGTKIMTARKQTIRYSYAETENGGRVNIVTTDPQSLAAVHSFLKFQITDHETGDSTAVRTR